MVTVIETKKDIVETVSIGKQTKLLEIEGETNCLLEISVPFCLFFFFLLLSQLPAVCFMQFTR